MSYNNQTMHYLYQHHIFTVNEVENLTISLIPGIFKEYSPLASYNI